MKIRHPFLIRLAGLLVAVLVRLWMGTMRYRYRPLDGHTAPDNPDLQGRYAYAFWHENFLAPAYLYARRDRWVLISQHADGQLIADTCRHLGLRTVAGSTTRGGAEALRQLLRVSRKGHIVLTPDGPRGPRRSVQPGLLYLASRTGLPVIPTAFAYQHAWRMKSWDRFALPRPWSAIVVVTAPAIHVPPDLGREQLAEYRERVEEGMRLAEESAQAHVAREGW